MIVYGELEVLGDSADPVVFESAEERPRSGDWLGLLLMTGRSGGVEEAAAAGGLLVENSRYGLVRQRLPAGVTTWSQDRILPWDVHVSPASELVIDSGATVRFAPSDLSGRGENPGLTELVVKGSLKIAGTPAGPVKLTVDSPSSDSLWYGLVLEADGVMEASHLEISQSGFALTGEVSGSGKAHLENATVRRTVHGINLFVLGELTIDGSTLKDVAGNALRASGTGLVRVRNSVIENIGWEGISLGNSNLQAISTRIVSSGQLDDEDPRSGLLAIGGRGQKIELWKCTVTGSTLHGLQLDPWEGEVELHGCEITGNRRNGILGSGLARMVFEDVVVSRNIGHGAVFADSRMEVWTTLFEDNVGTGLVLSGGTTGLIDMSDFASSSGMALTGVEGLTARNSIFRNGSFGVESLDSAPGLIDNRFENNLTAVAISGSRVPGEITGNSFVNNRAAIVNESGLPVNARGNYWGTADSTAIAALFEGEVDWRLFLTSEPRHDTAVEASADGLPERFRPPPGLAQPLQQPHPPALRPAPAGARRAAGLRPARKSGARPGLRRPRGGQPRRLLERARRFGKQGGQRRLFHRAAGRGLQRGEEDLPAEVAGLSEEPLAQQLLHQLRVRLAPRPLHHLSHQEPYRLVVARGDLGGDFRIAGNRGLHRLLQLAAVGDLRQPPLLDDLRRRPPSVPDGVEHLAGRGLVDGAGRDQPDELDQGRGADGDLGVGVRPLVQPPEDRAGHPVAHLPRIPSGGDRGLEVGGRPPCRRRAGRRPRGGRAEVAGITGPPWRRAAPEDWRPGARSTRGKGRRRAGRGRGSSGSRRRTPCCAVGA